MSSEIRPLVLIVEDDEGTAILQKRRLERASFRVVVASNIEQASSILASQRIDLVLIDYRIGEASGLDLHRRMKASGIGVPVIVVTAVMDDRAIIEAMRAGVRDVVLKNAEYLDYLPETVRGILRQPVRPEWPTMERLGNCVLIVEDDAAVAELQRRRLVRAGYDVIVAGDAEEAIRAVREGKITLAVIDLRLPGGVSGLDLYERLKKSGWDIPAIMVTAFPDQAVAIDALRLGIRDFIPKTDDYLDYLSSAVDRIATQAQVERKLVESELRFASIVGTTMDAIIMCDARADIVLFNRSAEEMFECPATDALRCPLSRFLPDLQLEPGDALTEGSSGTFRRRMELDGRTRSDRRVPIEVSVSDVIVHGERFFTVIARDISERRRTEQQLREADRRKDEFLGMLAHELRNPLAAIMTAGDVLERSLERPPNQKLTAVIKRQTQALARMVDDLLDVSRVTQGKIHLAKEPVLLDDVVQRAVESVRAAAEQKGLELTLEMPEGPAWLLGDATRLEQVLVNLLNNAIKFTPEGGKVRVLAGAQDDDAIVRVQDTGVGIDAELLPRVFDMFVQGDTSLDRSKSGLGIGLALVKQVMEMHGGSVTARSAGVGCGSEFEVRAPLYHGAAAQVEAQRAGAQIKRKMRLFVVDDQRDIAESVASLLAFEGHDCEAMCDGRAALEACLRHPPDAMVVDIGMPGMTGYELARRVRQEPRLAHIRLIAVTGYGREADRARAKQAGFDVHLTKPITSEEIIAAIREVSFPG